jgi:hypothetical protein
MDILLGWLMAVSVAYLHVDLVVARWRERSAEVWEVTGETKFTLSEKAGFCFVVYIAFCFILALSILFANMALDKEFFGLGSLAIGILSVILIRYRIIRVNDELEFKEKLGD